MNKSISIYNALCLPAPDVEALIQGQIITALPQKLLNLGQIFALYPVDISTIGIDKYYSSSFLATTQSVNNQVNYEEVTIKSWARCEFLEIPDKSKQLDILSQLTIWKPERFEKILQNRPHFFLAYLRVYHLDKPYEIPAIPNIQEKLGKFAPLPNNISVSEAKPVLSDHVFNQRKQQLENRQPPLHPELEELLFELSQMTKNNLYNLRPDNSNSFDNFQYGSVPSSWTTNKDILRGSGLFISLTDQYLDIPINVSEEELKIKFLEEINNNQQTSRTEKIIGNPPYNYNLIKVDFRYTIYKLVLENEIKEILGWSSDTFTNNRLYEFVTRDVDLSWIQDIAKVGNSSDGNEFERLVRKSLIKLGFSCSNTNPKANLDPDKLGGAGGLDFYCEYPYPVIGECKATKTEKVADSTVAQLVKLGLKHLQEEYNNCIKIIIAAGKLTPDTEKTAQGSKMNVIRPETLQKLVTLKAKHPGSIDLLNLKQDLEKKPFGEEADDKINKYIDKVEQEIKLRSHIIQLVKNYLQNAGIESTGVDTLHGAYFGSHPPQPLKPEEMHEILIELSSPLTGYLGREKGNDWKNDKFYYLRDLAI
ncbi:DUF1802 family protein [Sphaerospermopsis sp. FACHB-1094]|uniref:DUF1802 family protein n=1 Tax=Sphaerospermopsis sp. FACHB-1094 TaxID=2692861 RepID=UPI001F5548C5|nr:DUF1802 family protein [Sphaerospermopsis sp. FACHB-1094]